MDVSPINYTFGCLPEKRNKCPIPFGLLWKPFDNTISQNSNVAVSCSNCGGFLNLFCKRKPNQSWSCVFCQFSNNTHNCPELLHPTVYYTQQTKTAIVSPKNSVLSWNPTAKSVAKPLFILVIDGTMSSEQYQELGNTLESVLPPSINLGVLIFTLIVSIYQLEEIDRLAAIVFPGEKSPTDQDIYAIQNHETNPHESSFISTRSESILTLLRTWRRRDSKRCLATAIEYANVLFQTSRQTRGKLLVFTSGPCSYGPAAVVRHEDPTATVEKASIPKAQAYMAKIAASTTAVVEIYCIGSSNYCVESLEPLIRGTGGKVVLENTCREPTMVLNLQQSLNQPALPKSVLEIRTSKHLSSIQVIGPVADSKTKDDLLQSWRGKSFRDTVQLSSGQSDPSTTITILCDLQQHNIEDAYVQLISQVMHGDHVYLAVTTLAVPYAYRIEAFVSQINPATSLIVLAKKAVSIANTRSSQEARRFVESTIQAMKTFYPKFPRLNALRHGPLLGEVLKHPDLIRVMRLEFLRASLHYALQMLDPELYAVDPSGTWTLAPSTRASMQSTRFLVLDEYTSIFLWRGHQVDKEFDQLRQQAITPRPIIPKVYILEEHSSMSRYLQSRLAETGSF